MRQQSIKKTKSNLWKLINNFLNFIIGNGMCLLFFWVSITYIKRKLVLIWLLIEYNHEGLGLMPVNAKSKLQTQVN